MKKIKEQIDYGGRRERMDPNLERKLGDPENLYAKNPAMRKGVQDVQRLVSSRFGKVVDKLKRVTGIEEITPQVFQRMLVSEMMNRTHQTISIESRHRDELEQLAIDACLEESETEPDWYVIEAYLNRQPIDVSNFRYQPEEEEEEEEEEKQEKPQYPSFDIEDLTPKEELELEKHKRNIINALIQGAAKKGHYLFQKPDVKARLDAIDPNLYQNYLAIMAVNDYLYFSMEQMIEMMSETGQGVAGKVELDNNDDDEGDEGGGEERPDTVIRAYGLIFPIVCHEIIKGLEEAQGRHGLPKDSEMRQKVLGQTDTLSNEPMQLRIGPEIQEKLRFALPDEMYDEANKGLINWFKVVFYQIPAKEFLMIVGNAISEDESRVKKATDRFTEIMKEAMELRDEYDNWKSEQGSDEGPDDDNDDDDDDDIDDFLGSLGISRPQ